MTNESSSLSLPDREDAWRLFCEHNQSASLRKHALAVETVMRHVARTSGNDEHLWGLTGMLHDLDYEEHPTLEEHPLVGVGWLKERGYPEPLCQAILGHGDHTGVARETQLARDLYACDELTGFVVAVTYVRPNKSVHEVKVKSVSKKLKQKGFAAAVSRDEIARGVAELGVEIADHIALIIEALQENAEALGLAGTVPPAEAPAATAD